MKTHLIIGFFIALCAFSLDFSQAQAQKSEKIIPATHMWLQNREIMTFVPVRSLQQCEMLTRQAAELNSSESRCYNGERFLKEIECIKPVKRDSQPSCR